MPVLSFDEIKEYCSDESVSDMSEADSSVLVESFLSVSEQRKLCKQKIYRLISYRDRSSEELKQRLIEDEFEPALVDEMIEWCITTNLVNDQRFAEMFVSSKIRLGWGCEKIKLELSKKGILIESMPELYDANFSEEQEVERALIALSKSTSSAKNKRESYYRRLLSKGYSSRVASIACSKFMKE